MATFFRPRVSKAFRTAVLVVTAGRLVIFSSFSLSSLSYPTPFTRLPVVHPKTTMSTPALATLTAASSAPLPICSRVSIVISGFS